MKPYHSSSLPQIALSPGVKSCRPRRRNVARLVFAAGWLAWSAGIPSVRAQAPLFTPAPASPLRVGPGSGTVVIADFNRDGHPDLLTKHLLPQTVSVQFGDGQGRFSPAPGHSLKLDFQPSAMAAGDLDHDGSTDLAITTKTGDQERLHIFLGGIGGFRAAPGSPLDAGAITSPRYKPALRCLDLNADGKPDLVSEHGPGGFVRLFHGNGRGGFSPGPVNGLKAGLNYGAAGFAHLNGDGQVDLVAITGGGAVEVKLGNGRGGFTNSPGKATSAPAGAGVQLIADLNGDQRPDLVLKHGVRRLLTILLDDGQGGFAPATGSPLKMALGAFAVVAADVNGDRHTDLVAATVNNQAGPFESGIAVWLGNGHGFALAPGAPFTAGPGAYNVTTGDLNEDGKPDLVASSFESDAVTLLLGR